MKLTKKKFRKLVQEEIKKSSKVARKVLNENNIFKNTNRLLPNEWEEFKERFLKDNRNHKVRKGNLEHGAGRYEAIVDKSKPNKAIVKYLPDEMEVKHDMKPARFFDYIR